MSILTELKETSDLNALLSRHILEGVPSVFAGDTALYLSWRNALAERLEVDSHALKLVGSACVGTSLNPNKGFRAFGLMSDIDVAVISARHFDTAWYHLRMMPARRLYALSTATQNAIREHVVRYVYWGQIATDRILATLPFAQSWLQGLNEMAQREPTIGRTINIRLYRDIESLRAYQLRGFKDAQRRILEREV